METFLRRNFKVKGNIASVYKPDETELIKMIKGIEVQLWHKAPMQKIYLANGFTNNDGDFSIEFEVNSPVDYIIDGKISNVFLEAYYNGIKLEEKDPRNLLEGLVAYLKLDETSGTLAMDATGNGNNASLAGSPLPDWVPGKINNGLLLNGNADGSGSSYLSIPSTTDFDFGTADFTFALWIKPKNTSVGYAVFDAGYSVPNGIYCWFEYPNTFAVYGGSSLIYTRTYSMVTDEWHHFTLRRINGQLELFINGVSLGTETYTGNVYCAISELLFGQHLGGGVNLFGILDEIGIWKEHGLTNNEINFLYNNGQGRQYPF